MAMASWAQDAIAIFFPILRKGMRRRRRRRRSLAERERERWPRRCEQYSTLPLVAVFQLSRYGNKCLHTLTVNCGSEQQPMESSCVWILKCKCNEIL
jgi:hypothetical protein